MTTIKRNAIVPYSCRQMFELVNSIEEYPRFLPWCRESKIISQDETEITARLDVSWSGMHKHFTTKNRLHPYDHIEISLVDGPFRHLEGKWSFMPLGEHGCKIHLDLEFELTGHMMDMIFQPIFNHMANSFVELFCKRAAEVYGSR